MAGIFLIALLYVLHSTNGNAPSSEPNVQLSVTDKGLEYANQIIMGSLEKQVRAMAIPTANIKKWPGHLKIFNAKVNDISIKKSSFRINNGFIQFTLSLSRILISGDYTYEYKIGWFGTRTSSVFTAKMKDVSIVQDVALGRDATGIPTIGDRGCKTTITHSQFSFKKSVVLNIVAALAKSQFESKIQKLICKAVANAIKEKVKATPYPNGIKLNTSHCRNAEVRYPLAKRPTMTTDSIDIFITGKVWSSCHSPKDRLSNVSLARVIPSQDRMLSISLSDQFLNSLVNFYYQDGFMTTTFPVSMNQGNTSINVQATSSPVIKTTRNGSSMTFTANSRISGPASLGTLLVSQEDVIVKSELIFEVKNEILSLKFKNLRINKKPTKSIAASQPKSPILQLIQNYIPKITEALNQNFHKMVPLVMINKFELENERMLFGKGLIILQADLRY